MPRPSLFCGASATSLLLVLAPASAWAQQNLPMIEVGKPKPVTRSAAKAKPAPRTGASRVAQGGRGDSTPVAGPGSGDGGAPPGGTTQGASAGGQVLPGTPDANGNIPMGVYVTPDQTTATKMEIPIKDVPQPVQVVTPQKLSDLGQAVSSYNIAESVSGVFGSPTGGSGVGLNTPAYVIRGFNNNGRILRDGEFRNYFTQPIDLSGYDHVEFVKGPSSTLYGDTAGSFGGIVNYVTKKPTDKFFAEANGTIGSFGEHRTTIDINTPLRKDGSLLFRLNAAAEDAANVQHYVYHNTVDISPSLVWTFDNADKLTVTAEHTVTNNINGQGSPSAYQAYLLIPRWTYPGDVRSRQQYTQDNATFKFDHKFDNGWSVTAIADYNRQTQFLPTAYGQGGFDGLTTTYLGFTFPIFPTTAAAPWGNVEPYVHNVLNDQLIGQVDLKGDFDTGPLKHKMVLGLFRQNNWSRQNDMNQFAGLETINIWYPLYPFTPFYPTPGTPFAFPDASPTWSWQSALYGQDLIEITKELKLMIGGREDYIGQWQKSYDPTEQAFFLTDIFGNPTTTKWYSATFHKFSPRAGVVFEPLKDTSLFGSWGRSFTPNYGVLAAPYPGHIAAPETGEQFDIGLKQQLLDGKANFNVSLFDIRLQNVAVANPSDLTGRTSLINGEQRSHGIELDAAGEFYPNLRLTAAATFQHAVVAKDVSPQGQIVAMAQNGFTSPYYTSPLTLQGSELLGAPRRMFSLSPVYSIKEGALKGLDVGFTVYFTAAMPALPYNTQQAAWYALLNGGLFYNYFLGAYPPAGNNQYPFYLAPIQRLDLMASYQITDELKIQFNARNLADRANWISTGGSLFRSQPRAIFGTLTYRLDKVPAGIFAD